MKYHHQYNPRTGMFDLYRLYRIGRELHRVKVDLKPWMQRTSSTRRKRETIIPGREI